MLQLGPGEESSLKEMLDSNFEPAVLQRGKQLFRHDHVGPITRKTEPDNNVVYYSTQVVGSGGHIYYCRVHLFDDDILNIGMCSCPYSINCKHAAALVLALLNGHKPQKPSCKTPDQWLAALLASQGNSSQELVDPQNWSLCYLVQLEQQQPLLSLAERYRKRNGAWGRFQSVTPTHSRLKHSLNAADRELLSLIESMPRMPVRFGTVILDHSWRLRGAAGRVMLEYALRSGRALTMTDNRPLSWGSEKELELAWEPLEEPGKGKQQEKLFRLNAALQPEPMHDWQLEPGFSPPLYRAGYELGPVRTPLTAEQLQLIQTMPPIPETRCAEIAAHLQHGYGVPFTGDEHAPPAAPTESTPVPRAELLGVNAFDGGILPVLSLSVRYGPVLLPLQYDEAVMHRHSIDDGKLTKTDEGFVYLVRDRAQEYHYTEQLRELSLIPREYGADTGELWGPSEVGASRHIATWNRLKPALENLFDAEGWELVIDDSYQTRTGNIQVSGRASDLEQGWFGLRLNLELQGMMLDTELLLEQWLDAGAPESLMVQDTDGHWVAMDMQPLQPVWRMVQELYQGDGLDKPVRLPAFRALELDKLESVDQRGAPGLKKLRQELKDFKGLKTVAPARHLRAELREYQQQGLDWLMFLHRYRFGGILADDMGLGKTLQTLAFIQRLKAGRKLSGGALVVAPTSLVWNWQREAEKFTPNLSCLVLHGQDRHDYFNRIPDCDLVITTYGLLHRDFEHYADHTFAVAVLDEAQKIKNHRAKITRKVKHLQARVRLCLTGTPLENHLGELWSLADFALPGLLNDYETFQKMYRLPIEQDGDTDKAEALSRRMAPFMLRRTKTEVVKELPQKTEIQQTIHLAGDQQALYESIRVSMEKRVRELVKEKGLDRSRIEFLDALLKLRQACIDPRLVKLRQALKVKHSAKMTWLKDTLPEMVEEGRRVLVFSQFTEMLNHVEKELQTLDLKIVKLTGRTRNREAAIRRFQEGDVPVFLISLKAGGAGLNLTAADTVIHLDPWWNPAVENQATDRAYRIGQDKPVFVYKLVAAGTVEEKIQQMQQHKQQLADKLFDQTREAGLPGSGDELLALFQHD